MRPYTGTPAEAITLTCERVLAAIDADGNIIAEQVLAYEVPDFLRLRVDPAIAAGCKTVPAE